MNPSPEPHDPDEFEADADGPQPEPIDLEASYVCGQCGEEIVVPLDPTAGASQEYVEDCPVCCHPNVLRVAFDGSDSSVDAELE